MLLPAAGVSVRLAAMVSVIIMKTAVTVQVTAAKKEILKNIPALMVQKFSGVFAIRAVYGCVLVLLKQPVQLLQVLLIIEMQHPPVQEDAFATGKL